MSLATDAQLSRVRNAALARTEAEQALAARVADLRAEMRRAAAAGYTSSEIGQAAGLSRQRVRLATRQET